VLALRERGRRRRIVSNLPISTSSQSRVSGGLEALRNALTIAVLVVWVTMGVLLVQRQVPPASTSLAELGDLAALPPIEPPSPARPGSNAPGTAAGAGQAVSGTVTTDGRREEWFGIVQAGRKIVLWYSSVCNAGSRARDGKRLSS